VKTIVKAGKYKAEGEGALSDEARAHVQSRIDDYYTTFVHQVARHRNVSVDRVRNGYGEGRTLGAKAALAAGMVDGIATLQDVVHKYARRRTETANRGSTVAASAVDVTQRASGSVALAQARIRLAELGAAPAPLARPAVRELDDYRAAIARAAAADPRKS
jgi:ClpP class serine protease